MSFDRWAHQPREVAYALDPARALFWSPRTGKTRTMVECIKRQVDGGVRRILVVGPGFPLREVWKEELQSLRAENITICDLSFGKLIERRAIIHKALTNSDHRLDLRLRAAVVFLVNWEALAPLVNDLLKWRPDVVIADEAHYAKSAGAARTRALQRLGRVAKYRRALTGTPTPRDYVDLYAQYKFLDPSLFGTNKEKFIERYVELDEWHRPKYYKNLPEMQRKMLSIASVFDRKKEWNDQPPLEIRRRIVMPEQARTLYDKIVKDTVAEWDGAEIDATHKLSRLVKLQQLTAGYIRDDEGNAHWTHTAKLDGVVSEIADLLDAGEKVVVFYHFAEEGKRIEQTIRSEYGAVVGRIGGDTPIGSRSSLQKSFLTAKSLQVMVMQDSLGIGISLKSASYLIRTSYPLDYAAFVQSNERIYEPDKTLTYIALEVPNSVDQFGRKVCSTKGVASDAILGSISTSDEFKRAAYGGGFNLELVA